MAPDRIRSFLALDLAAPLIEELAAQIETLRPLAPGARFVSAESLHVTLRFLGGATQEQLARVSDEIGPIASECPPAVVPFGDLESYPTRGVPRVVWLSLTLPEPLLTLQRCCEAAAVTAGFAAEVRPFRAHLTLARWRDAAGSRPRLPARLEVGPARFDRLVLYSSEPTASGSKYTVLQSFPLRGAS